MNANENKLLTREQFKELVFKRDGHKCVFCGKTAVDAHHIFDRKLFINGGYYLNNGASVCEEDHWKCETTEHSVEDVLAAAKITERVLPPILTDPLLTEFGTSFDKWGNVCLSTGKRMPGPMFHEENVQKILKKAGLLHLFSAY